MKLHKLQARKRQVGVTLLELTVVLIIIVALAGLMIPSYPVGLITSTQDSTGVSNLAEMDKWIQVYNAKFMKEPNNMEALINGVAGTSTVDTNCTGAIAAVNTVYCKMMSTSYFAVTTVNTVTPALAAADLQRAMSLTMAGITSVYYNDPNTLDATFKSIIGGDPTRINDDTVHHLAIVRVPVGVVAMIESYLATVFSTTADQFDGTCYDYVPFGIGNQSSLTGTVMSTAPVYFSDQSSTGQVVKYNRFVAIYQVDKLATAITKTAITKGCASGTESAKFIGSVVSSKDGHLIGLANTQFRSAENTASGN